MEIYIVTCGYAALAVLAIHLINPRKAKNRTKSNQTEKTRMVNLEEEKTGAGGSGGVYEEPYRSLLRSISASDITSGSFGSIYCPSNDKENGAMINMAILYIFHSTFFIILLSSISGKT
jgi:hypothetical protein